jgi:hypothetical protein
MGFGYNTQMQQQQYLQQMGYIGMGMYGGMGGVGGTQAGMGAYMGAYMGYNNLSGLSTQMLGGYGGYGGGFAGFGGGYAGVNQMSNYYGGGGYLNYTREAMYQTVTETQATTTNDPGRMFDVNFDYKAGQSTQTRSPIILDLNGDGKPNITGSNILGNGKVEGQTTMFDIDPTNNAWQYKSYNNGKYYEKNANKWGAGEWGKEGNKNVYYFGKKEEREQTEWLEKNSGDGFLVWDVDKDGKITSSKELFGNYDIDGKQKFNDGYEKLSQYFDANKDGVVNGDELKGLNIWKDTNADGITQDGELVSLASQGVTSLDLRNINRTDMSAQFNREKTTYEEVTKEVLTGYKDTYNMSVTQGNTQTNGQAGAYFGMGMGMGMYGGMGAYGGYGMGSTAGAYGGDMQMYAGMYNPYAGMGMNGGGMGMMGMMGMYGGMNTGGMNTGGMNYNPYAYSGGWW